MSDRVVGTCSLCSGPVVVPLYWHSIYPPVPTCRSCGATQRQPYGPVIPMEPKAPLGKDKHKYKDNGGWGKYVANENTPHYRQTFKDESLFDCLFGMMD